MLNPQTKLHTPACPKCQASYTVKKGKRRNRLQILQLYQCAECLHRFTGAPGRNKTYPLRHILDAISTYNLGHSVSETQRMLRRRTHLDVPEGTARSWLEAYRSFTTYARLRAAGRKLFEPVAIIRSYLLEHQQIYRFQAHQAKLRLLLATLAHRHLVPVSDYLQNVDNYFPHQLFQATEHRSSKFPATLHVGCQSS